MGHEAPCGVGWIAGLSLVEGISMVDAVGL